MSDKVEMWAILELMGHVRLAGRVTEEERFGAKMGRIDVPNAEGGFTTQFFGGSSIYRLTPTTEEIARHVAATCQPTPVHSWELPKRLSAPEKVPPAFNNSYRDAADEPDPLQDERDEDSGYIRDPLF